jgi:hypothetical protein
MSSIGKSPSASRHAGLRRRRIASKTNSASTITGAIGPLTRNAKPVAMPAPVVNAPFAR